MQDIVCKVCLSIKVQMFNIIDTPLREIYEKLTAIPFDRKDGKPSTVCYLCVARLNNCLRLQELARQTDKILTELLDNKLIIEESTLNIFKKDAKTILSAAVLSNIDISDDTTDYVKSEKDEIKVELPKHEEHEEELNDVAQYSDVDTNIADDSDDDLPLKSIATNTGRIQKVKKRKHKTESIQNSKEIVLTHEQQMFELIERSKSLNYLNSPYKCDLCYKGFINSQAYNNHKDKHSEASGALQCSVCRLRYGSARQLRAHAAAAHERRYVCNICQHRSHTKNQALVHERWHEGHTYPCKLCGEVFSRPTTYLTHMRKSHSSSHVCVRCGHSFVGRLGLLMHASKAHRDDEQKADESTDKRPCKECGIEFSCIEALTRHVLTTVKHTAWRDDSSECRICEAPVQKELRREHMRAHARAVRPACDAPRSEPLAMLPCEQCSCSFATRARLAAHVRAAHLGLRYDRNVICELCGKKCTSAARLRYHQRCHSGARPHVCVSCGARFRDTGQLRVHSRVHSGERPHECGECGKRFTQRPALNRHYRVHTGAKPYECQLCSKSFSQSNSVKLHVNTVHLKLTPQRKRNKQNNVENTQ